MPVPTIAPYFPFRRIKIVEQIVSEDARAAQLRVQPNKRFQPVCHRCGLKVSAIHSWTRRRVRDLNLAGTPVWITCDYRKLFCTQCRRICIEDLELFHPYLRVTTRMARYIYQLCQVMTVTAVASHLNLDWKTVKAIDKHYLENQYGQPNYDGLKLLAVDEISIRKGHRYLTVVLDYVSGRVLYVGKARKAKTLMRFFNQLKPRQRKSIQAVVMDMWDPYIKAVNQKLPHAKIVFDLFHVVANFNRVIDKVRNSEYRKASKDDKAVYKGAKYLLLKNRKNVRRKTERQQLKDLLTLNEVINTVMILKEKLKHIWSYRSRSWAAKALDYWCALASSLKNRSDILCTHSAAIPIRYSQPLRLPHSQQQTRRRQ